MQNYRITAHTIFGSILHKNAIESAKCDGKEALQNAGDYELQPLNFTMNFAITMNFNFQL
jgi:hypothetical protein